MTNPNAPAAAQNTRRPADRTGGVVGRGRPATEARPKASDDDATMEAPRAEIVVWDMGGIFRAYPTEAMARHGREHGWPLDRIPMGPTGELDDDRYQAMSVGALGEREYLRLVLADLAEVGIEFDPFVQPASFYPDREIVWQLLRELGADDDRRQAIVTNDASRWLGEGWWETWPHRHLFETIVDSTQVGVRKPDPAPYREVLRRLGDPDPASCVFVDDMVMNTAAAEAVGMRSVLFDITDPEGSVADVRTVVGL